MTDEEYDAEWMVEREEKEEKEENIKCYTEETQTSPSKQEGDEEKPSS